MFYSIQSYLRESTIHFWNKTRTPASIEGQPFWLINYCSFIIFMGINFYGFSENDIYKHTGT